jgi:hypothetical protein
MSVAEALNGYRVPLIINAATLIPIVWVLINMYSDLQQLKSDRLERGPVERLAKIETQMQLGIDNRYRAIDATRDFALRDAEIARLKEDVKMLREHK